MFATQILRVQVCTILSPHRPSVHPYFYPAKKEAKRLEKEAKLAAKAAKVGPTPAAASDKKPKAEKEKKEKDVEQPFVNTTPKGEKKGM